MKCFYCKNYLNKITEGDLFAFFCCQNDCMTIYGHNEIMFRIYFYKSVSLNIARKDVDVATLEVGSNIYNLEFKEDFIQMNLDELRKYFEKYLVLT